MALNNKTEGRNPDQRVGGIIESKKSIGIFLNMKKTSLMQVAIASIALLSSLNLYFHYRSISNVPVSTTKNKEQDDIDFTIVCPSNIYSAGMIVENDTMKIIGPKGCSVPFYSKPLESFTSNHRAAKWIVSAGGSTFFGVSMNLLRMFIDESDYLYDKLAAQQALPSDIVELVVDTNGKSLIRAWKIFSDYECFSSLDYDDQNENAANIVIRVTILHSRWMVSFFLTMIYLLS
jgi:hypothetical protein